MNTGIFKDSTQGISGIQVSKSMLEKLHTPTLYVLGGETDIAYANGMDDYERIHHVPVFMANLVGVGHGGSYWNPNGGKAAELVVAWLDWQLRGDATAARKFTSAVGFRQDPAWKIDSRTPPSPRSN
jgi:hypothetical protein